MKPEEGKLYIEKQVEINYSHIDADSLVKPVEIARLFQNLFLYQDRLMALDGTRDDSGWILLNYDLNIYRYAQIGEKVKVATYPYSFNRFYGNRIFLMKDENEEILAEAKSKWLFVNKKTFKIKRVTEDIAREFGDFPLEKGRGFEVDSLKSELIEKAAPEDLMIRHDDIDFNGHVNNTVYFSVFFDFTPKEILESYKPYKIQIMYKKQILLEDAPVVRTVQYEEDSQLYTEYEISSDEGVFTTIKVLWRINED